MHVAILVLVVALIASTALAFYFWSRVKSCTHAGKGLKPVVNNVPQNIVSYNTDACKAFMSSCIDPTNRDKACLLHKWPTTQAFFGYKVNILNTDSSVAGKHCSFEYMGKQLCKNGSPHNWNDQGRPVYIYYPTTVLQEDKGLIPYVIYFSFTQWDTTDIDADSLSKQGYGLFNPDRRNACTKGEPCGQSPTPPTWMQLQLQAFLAAGYAVLLTTMIGDDSYMYQETCKPPLKSTESIYNLCWNNGHNPDASYLTALFKAIQEQTLFTNPNHTTQLIPADPTLGKLHEGAANFHKKPIHLDSRSCGLIGYSVGAQMVSRAINEFGSIPVTVEYSPDVKVGCMIAGGSLHCYEHCNGDSSTARGPGRVLCEQQPKEWGPCWNPKSLGCCPLNLTEPRYDKKSEEDHPPVILVQTDFDYYADPRASENYYSALKMMGVDTEIVHGMCGNHDLFPAAVIPVLRFFVKYMTPTPYSTLSAVQA